MQWHCALSVFFLLCSSSALCAAFHLDGGVCFHPQSTRVWATASRLEASSSFAPPDSSPDLLDPTTNEDKAGLVTIEEVITDEVLLEASIFSIQAFFGEIDQEAFKTVQLEQFRLWLGLYGSRRSRTSAQAKFFAARNSEGRVVGCASVAVKPYCSLKSGALTFFNPFGDPSLQRGNFDLVPTLVNVAVCPSQRRQGIGERLGNECESVARTWGFNEVHRFVLIG